MTTDEGGGARPNPTPALGAASSIGLVAVIAIAIVALLTARGWAPRTDSDGGPVAGAPDAVDGTVGPSGAGVRTGTSPPATPSTGAASAETIVSPYADACAGQAFSMRQCDAIIDDAMDGAGLQPADVESVEFLPFEQVMTLGGGQVALVRFHLVVGTGIDQAVQCVGVSFRPACNDVAEIQVHGGVDHDVPCIGEPPEGCATLPPTPDPDAVAAATPFRLASIDIPLDRKGRFDVLLGTATLPNGYLSERSFTLAEPRPTSYWINEGVLMDVRSEVVGRPFVGSVFRDPFEGPEPVSIHLVFDVTHLEAPSVLQVRGIVVR